MSDCPKCGGTMEDGFVVDKGDYDLSSQPGWNKGTPRKAWWGGLKVDKRTLIPVSTFRCRRCGFLEEYARGSASDA